MILFISGLSLLLVGLASMAFSSQMRIKQLEAQAAEDQEMIMELLAKDQKNRDRLRACGAVTCVADIHAGKAK